MITIGETVRQVWEAFSTLSDAQDYRDIITSIGPCLLEEGAATLAFYRPSKD